MTRRTGMPPTLKSVLTGSPAFITLEQKHVGKAHLKAFGRSWSVSDFIGRILPGDVGKRVFLVGKWPHSFLQVENDEQRADRLARESAVARGQAVVDEITAEREEKRRAWRIARAWHYASTRSTMQLAQMLVALEDNSGAEPEFDIDEEWPS